VGQFVTKILNNLQITIRSLHLRYEDTGSNKNPFAFGVTLEELNIYSTDHEWKQTFLTEEQVKQKTIYKVRSRES
jgi:vacuolar protein sorting-associated protein 13A/C